MSNLVVTIEQGQIRGKTATDIKGNTYYSFQGIPYAKPPIGKLRFKAPSPPDSWQGIRDATEEGDGCYAKHMFLPETVGAEDCLFINVFTPELSESSAEPLKPVMVWIYGGAFTKGSSSTDFYGPELLIPEDVVLVTFNYRIGALGFLSFEDPSLGVPGNAGLKDMVMALKWVQKNVARFKGDPDNVTIFGESAGGMSVHHLMLSPMAEGLFHRAIAQSGSALLPWAKGSRIGKELAKHLNFNSDDDKDILEYLQTLPVGVLHEAQEKLKNDFDISECRAIGPVVESPSAEPAFISEEPLDIILKGKYSKVPLMMGYTSREGMLADIYAKRANGQLEIIKDFKNAIPITLNISKDSDYAKELAQKIQTFYYGDEEPSDDNLDPYYLLQTDTFFLFGIYDAIKHHLSTSNIPIYFYRFSLETNLNVTKKMQEIKLPGVCHGDDVCYLFTNLTTPKIIPHSTEDIGYRRVVKLWTTFARTGNPNPINPDPLINIKWKPVTREQLNFLDIGENLTVGLSPEAERMAFWEEIHNAVRVSSKL